MRIGYCDILRFYQKTLCCGSRYARFSFQLWCHGDTSSWLGDTWEGTQNVLLVLRHIFPDVVLQVPLALCSHTGCCHSNRGISRQFTNVPHHQVDGCYWRVHTCFHKHLSRVCSMKSEMLVALDSHKWPVEGAKVGLPVPHWHIACAILCSHQLGRVDASTPCHHRLKLFQR